MSQPIQLTGYKEDKPREECGVFGVYAEGRNVARLSFFGLYALQHRGQESAGIVSYDDQKWILHNKNMSKSSIF